MIIKKSNNSVFKVYAEGSKKEIKEFFEEAMMLWKNVKHVN
jgi:ribosomal protein L23